MQCSTIILHALKCRNVTPRVNSYICLHKAAFNSMHKLTLKPPSLASRQGHCSRRSRGRAVYNTDLGHLKLGSWGPNSNSGRDIHKSFSSYSTTKKMHLLLKLFILVKHSTCFRRSFRPSSGAQNCTYGNRYMSNSCCYLLLAAGTFPG